MAPTTKKLKSALVDATVQVFAAEPDATTVNKVRKQAETNLSLESGFFSGAEWKQSSKDLIKEHVEKLLDGWRPETKQESADEEDIKPKAKKNGAKAKRLSSEPELSPPPKRQKRAAKSYKEESSDFDLSEEEEKKPKKKTTKSRGKIKADSSDEEDAKPRRKQGRSRVVSEDEDEDVKMSPSPDAKRKREASDDEYAKDVPMKSESSDEEDKTTVKKRSPFEEEIKITLGDVKDEEEEDSKPTVDEEDEYSDVIDEPPVPKGKKKGAFKKEPKSKPAKSSSATKKSAAPTPDDPKEAEIKKLQGQLVKCGVRKLWHNELKRYGNDDRAKIRHLKKMLADIGMDGRFSESKAREIKESRELLAEVEAAQDMDSLWGTSGRASRNRSKTKSMKEVTDSEDDDDDDDKDSGVKASNDDEEEEEETAVAAKRRARADLAFLGDDSDSD